LRRVNVCQSVQSHRTILGRGGSPFHLNRYFQGVPGRWNSDSPPPDC
jgi:hypothetical protein